MLPAITFPIIDPVAIAIGPFAVRWYALAYISGILLGWRYCLWLARRRPVYFEPSAIDDFVLYATLGIVLGGRLGFVLFYNLPYYLQNPLEIFMVWQGGMSFHGGLLGVLTAIGLFARRVGVPFVVVGDIVAAATPIGLFFGRIANFVNAELFGRPAPEVPWAMVFPRGGPVPRHPSQLYEAAMEGALLFVILLLIARRPEIRERPGQVGGAFLVGYGVFRTLAELFREPDAQIGFLSFGFTMGQLLSLPMIVAGLALILYARSRPPVVPAPR
ncbi:Prolipoprotein diacylglyceryl transferase [alpha proteobacterium BAL199]|jgi:phosphatidylglycerol---prolipoprotein diacylglyceryl transferase|nr:Prolipoprotein diacylglyceryl transferase [alpha proteobacterium BAL199]